MTRLTKIIMGLLLLAAAQDTRAQWNVARFEASRNYAYTTFGLNPAVVPAVGYGRVVRLADHNFQFTADLGVVAASLDVSDFRGRLAVQTSMVRWRSVHFAGSATFITRGTENSIYNGFNFGADFTGALGVYRGSWFAAGEFGFDKAIVTYIEHSDWYRTYYYAGAKDGWYLATGGTFHYGFAGGIPLGRAEVIGRFGWTQTEDFNDLMPPMYASLGVGVAF
jgi:hypothetical protein